MLRDNLKNAISASKLYVKELAAMSGVSKRTIDKWIGAESTEPKVYDLYEVCKVLNITMEWAVDGEKGLKYVRHIISKEGRLWKPPERIRSIVGVLFNLDNDTLRIVEKMITALKARSLINKHFLQETD
jgi:transcriptional regulator with XRE-family HTH domain